MSKNKKLYRFCSFLELLLLGVPAIIYTVKGYIQAETEKKMVLTLCIIAAGILLLMALTFKFDAKISAWVLSIGLFVATGSVLEYLLVMGIASILSGMILEPLAKHYKERWKIQRELERHGP